MPLVRFLLGYSRGTLVAAIVAGAASGALSAVLLASVNALIHPSGADSTRTVWLFLACATAAPLTRLLSEWCLLLVGQNTQVQLRLGLARKILATPLSRIEEIRGHRILTVLTDDVGNLVGFMAAIPVAVVNLAVVLSCFTYIGIVSLPLLGFIVVLVAFGISTFEVAVRRARRKLAEARTDQDLMMRCFQTLINGIKELKLNGTRRISVLMEEIEPIADRLRRRNISGIGTYMAAAVWGQFLVFLFVGAVAALAPSVARIDPQTLAGVTLVLFYLTGPLQIVTNLIPQIARANIAVTNIERLGLTLDERGGDIQPDAAVEAPHGGTLELRDLTYAYRTETDEQFVLGPISVRIEQGEIVFITGGNGSGKTTLAKLLTGLYSPTSGDIRLNGREVTDASRDHYRQNFSAIFTDFHLFDSILGARGHAASDLTATDYLGRLRLQHKVRVANGRLSTTDLSHGQRKRLALLLAYLEERPIYVFDEWAADQDTGFRDLFYRELLPDLKAQGKTVIVISHDERYYETGDRLLKFEGGALVSDRYVGTRHAATLPDTRPVGTDAIYAGPL